MAFIMTDTSSENPAQLLSQARGGDAGAVTRLLEQYRNYLSLLARIHIDQHLQSKADPSDLVQETFMHAVRDFPKFRGTTEAEFLGWLRKIVANNGAKLVRHYRGTQRRDVTLERRLQDDLDQTSLGLAQGLVAADSSPSQQAARREAAVVLADALARLPADYREVMILHHLESRTIAETAQQMGRTIDSIKKLLARALIRLRGLMKGTV